MIINSFDNKSEAIIKPKRKNNVPVVDAYIVTFSHIIENMY